MMRRPYKTACRFFRNSSAVSTVRWVEVPDDTPAFPGISIINNSKFEKDGNQNGDVGEVFGAPVTFTFEKAPNGLFSGHICGTETDFENGGMRDETESPVQYGAFGFPKCCAPPLRVIGGAGAGGVSRFFHVPLTPATQDCTTATPLALATEYAFITRGSGVRAQWVRFPLVNHATYRITKTGPVDNRCVTFVYVSNFNACGAEIGHLTAPTFTFSTTIGVSVLGLETTELPPNAGGLVYTLRVDRIA